MLESVRTRGVVRLIPMVWGELHFVSFVGAILQEKQMTVTLLIRSI